MEIVQRSWLRGCCIGQGSFGTVHLAVDKSDGHVFAVKSVEHTSANSQLIALENEIRLLKSLESPYVVNYLGDDVSKENFTTYRNLHVEYMPGGTAADLLEFPGADVDEGIVSTVTRCVASALKYVHSLGIVHCDVKGRNVLVGSSKGVAKLADFGSALELKEWKLPRGSPLWMAPEVIRGEYQGPESDVWSLGCTVIEMVTGKPAWEDRGYDTVFRIGYSDESPKIPTQLSQLGKDFLDKCLRRNHKERWSCDQLLQHPFLLSACLSDVDAEVSPRCTLDWVNSNFSDEDDDQDQRLFNFESDKSKFDSTKVANSKNSDFNGKDRISKLASKSGAIWEESDGWVSVRTLANEKEQDSNSCYGAGKKEKERVVTQVGDLTEEATETYSVSKVSGEISGGINRECLDSKHNNNVSLNDVHYKYFSDKFTARAEAVFICPHVFPHQSRSYCTASNHRSWLYYFYCHKCKHRPYIKILCFALSVQLHFLTCFVTKNDYIIWDTGTGKPYFSKKYSFFKNITTQ